MKRKLALGIFLFFVLPVTSGPAQELTIISEDSPPFNFIKDGVLTGSSTEVVREIMRRLNQTADIQVMTWARGYQLAEDRRGTALQQLGKRFAYTYYGEIPQTIGKKMTERSDILKSSIFNRQYSIPTCPVWVLPSNKFVVNINVYTSNTKIR